MCVRTLRLPLPSPSSVAGGTSLSAERTNAPSRCWWWLPSPWPGTRLQCAIWAPFLITRKPMIFRPCVICNADGSGWSLSPFVCVLYRKLDLTVRADSLPVLVLVSFLAAARAGMRLRLLHPICLSLCIHASSGPPDFISPFPQIGAGAGLSSGEGLQRRGGSQRPRASRPPPFCGPQDPPLGEPVQAEEALFCLLSILRGSKPSAPPLPQLLPFTLCGGLLASPETPG